MIRRKWMAFAGGIMVLVGVALFAVVQAGEEKPTTGPEDRSQQLRERLEKLEARVAQLEQRAALTAFPVQAPVLPYTAPPYLVPQVPSVPEGWVPREFNGVPYYIVPLAKRASAR